MAKNAKSHAGLEKKYGHLDDEKAKKRETKKEPSKKTVHGRELFDLWQLKIKKAQKEAKEPNVFHKKG